MIFDLIIIGAGPAGITAAVYAARKGLKLMVIAKNIGGQVSKTSIIENYTGYQEISGEELVKKLDQHLTEFKFDIKKTEAKNIIKKNNLFEVETEKEMFQCKALIIATGAKPKNLGMEGESEFKNRGVTYCTTCDGPLFKDKDVVVIGGGNSALESVLQLSNIAKKIYLIIRGEKADGDLILLEKIMNNKNITIFYNAAAKAVRGNKSVETFVFVHEGKEKSIDVQGIFINIGFVPNSSLVKEIVNLNQKREIEIDPGGATSMAGIFAAGDVTDVPEKQIIIAAGEGSKAALSAFRYLAQHRL